MDTTLSGKCTGVYSQVVSANYDVIKHLMPLALDAIDTIDFTSSKRPFVICEFGSADGGVSLELVTACIAKIRRKYGETQKVHVYYNDIETNDFNGLFVNMKDTLLQDEFTTVFACCKNFYSQCMDDNSVHLAISSMAFHWLSDIPCLVKDSIYAGFSNDADTRAKFLQQSAKDWESILRIRQKELIKGGQLVVTMCGGSDYDTTFSSDSDKPSIIQLFDDVIRAMVTEQVISKEEYEKITFPWLVKTSEQCMEPLRKNSYWEVITTFHKKITCHYLAHELGDASDERFLKLMIAMKMVFYKTFIDSLDASRSHIEKMNLVETILDKVSTIVKADGFMATFDTNYMEIKKL